MPREGDNMMGVKRTNRSAALFILHELGGISRKRLAEEMKLTPAAITKIVSELMDDGLVQEGSTMPSCGAGRREILVTPNIHSHFGLGMLINTEFAILSAVWLDGSIIFSEKIPLVREAPADETVEFLSAHLLELVRQNALDISKAAGVGVAIRGIVASDGRTVVNSFGALDTKQYPIANRVSELTGLKCTLANNVRALFMAEHYLSKEHNSESQFFLRCEYGIGASLVMNGQICNGTTGQCAEIGHIPVIKRGGKPCVCGKSGCLETIASPTAIEEDARAALSADGTPILWKLSNKKGAENIDLNDIFEAARNGDSGAASIVDRAVAALGQALKSVIYIIDPDKIVLYGRMFDNSYCLTRLYSEMSEGIDIRHKVTIEKSRYNHRLDNVAASLLAVNEFFINGGIL